MVALAPTLAPAPAANPSDSAFRVPTSAFPTLSPTGAALFHALLENRLNLHKTAAATNTSLADVLDFADRPDIAERIESYQRLRLAAVNDAFLDSAAEARLGAIKQLQELSKATDCPIERRRHAHLILRYATPIRYPLPAAGRAGEGFGMASLLAAGRAGEGLHESSRTPIPPSL